ncbi:MAG: hypothetical protein R6U59_00765 [Eubacteriales bacterium]
MNKLLLFIGMCILITTAVSAADSCRVNEVCTWYAAGNSATNNVSLTIKDNTGTDVYTNVNMTNIGNNIYAFNSNITNTGQYVGIAQFYNSTGFQGTSEETKDIYTEEANTNLTMIAQVLQPFLIFLIGAVILLLGLFTKERDGFIYNIFAGTWWLGSSAYMLYSGTVITSIFYVMLGFVTIYFGISKLGAE